MKILVIHDREEVSEQISEIVGRTCSSDCRVEFAYDGSGAAVWLRNELFDLVIMDLTLPYIRGRMSPNLAVAEGLLREIFELDSLNPPGDIIGLSRDIEALDLLRTTIGPHLMAMIEEDDEGRWKQYLSDRVVYASKASEARQYSSYRHHTVDVLIVTALDEEFEPYVGELDLTPVKQYDGAKRFMFRDRTGTPRTGIAYCIGRSGQPRAASRTQSLLSVFRPRLALMSGICGGFEGKVDGGDLLFFETVYDWDYGKWEGEGSKARFVSRCVPLSIDETPAHRVARLFVASNFNSDGSILARLHADSEGELREFSMRLTQVGSGSAVVANGNVSRHIRDLNDSIRAVDMEAYGFYHAAQTTHVVQPQVLCVKAVSDHANPLKDDAIHLACSALSALAVLKILRDYWDFS